MIASDFKISKSLVCPNALRISEGRVVSLGKVTTYVPRDPLQLNYVHWEVTNEKLEWTIRNQTEEVYPRALELGPESWDGVPMDGWTIQPVSFNYLNGAYYVNFGTKVYNSYEEAQENLWDTRNLYEKDELILCGWILSKGEGYPIKSQESPNIQVISVDQTMLTRLGQISRPDSRPLDIEVLKGIFRGKQEYFRYRMTTYLKFVKSRAESELRCLLSAFIPSNYIDSFDDKISIEKTANFSGDSYFRISLDGVNLFE